MTIYSLTQILKTAYSVTLDDGPVTQSSIHAGTSQNNTIIFSATSLDLSTEHRMVMKNVHDTPESGVLKIDYMIITTGDGNAQCVRPLAATIVCS